MVAVMVPAEYVPHVARLIAELDSKRGALAPPDRHSLAPKQHVADWPVEELRRLSAGRSRSLQTVLPVLDYLAEQPEVFHRVPDIVAALGLPPERITGAMAGLTRIVKAHHDFAAWGLPVHRRLTREPGSTQMVSYSMSTVQADRWRQVRGRPDVQSRSVSSR